MTIRKDVLEAVPFEPLVQVHQVVAYDMDPKKIKLATLNLEICKPLNSLRKKPTESGNCTHHTFEHQERTRPVPQRALCDIQRDYQRDNANGRWFGREEFIRTSPKTPIIRIVDSMLEYAIFESASDIHIEPQEADLIVRYRIDGRLKQVQRPC